jgi:hypothetical protein
MYLKSKITLKFKIYFLTVNLVNYYLPNMIFIILYLRNPCKQRKRLRRFFYYMIIIRFFRNEFLNFDKEIKEQIKIKLIHYEKY